MTNSKQNADLVADYLGEAHDYLEQMNKILLALDEGGQPWAKESVTELFRSAHSLKGLSACFGFERTNAVTHELETLLTLVRDGKLNPTPAIVRAMFSAIDLVQHLAVEIASSCTENVPIDLVMAELAQAARAPEASAPAAPGSPAAGKPAVGVAKAEKSDKAGAAEKGGAADANETVRVRMDRLDKMVNLTGELVVTRSRLQLVVRQLRSLQRLHELGTIVGELSHGVAELAGLQQAPERLHQDLPRLLERLQDQSARLQAGHGELVGTGRVLRDLDDTAYDLDGVVGGIHEAVLAVRMVPLDTVFRRLQRVVRDTADHLQKQVDFEVAGGDTQIDKRVADELVNPLVHMLRNSVDHGLEDHQTRERAGKPRRGTVRVRSFQRGSSVVIEVGDDGGGIDPQRVLKKAVETGLVTADEAAAMTPQQAQRLVFAPGFSTAKQVTEVSGRGMGMDIVAASIKRLRGSLDLVSEVGTGTTFTIQLPPSMSILSSLLLEVRGTMFALPLTEVREIVELSRARVHQVQSRRVIVVRDRPMPLVHLPETYRFAAPAAEVDAVPAEHAVVFGYPGSEIALAVDRLLGKEDLVIKPLCSELTAVRGLAGMAIRGDGKVTLILEPAGFAEYALEPRASAAVPTS
jgi:two-component system chemotaxis sensor kinase CheA